MRTLLVIVSMVMLTGCTWFSRPSDPVESRTIVVVPEIYHPPMPTPLQLEDVTWFVLTRDNIDAQMSEIERVTGHPFVVYGVVPKAYENMAWNFQEVRRYVRQLQALTTYYQRVTKSPAGSTPEEWIEFNRTLNADSPVE